MHIKNMKFSRNWMPNNKSSMHQNITKAYLIFKKQTFGIFRTVGTGGDTLNFVNNKT